MKHVKKLLVMGAVFLSAFFYLGSVPTVANAAGCYTFTYYLQKGSSDAANKAIGYPNPDVAQLQAFLNVTGDPIGVFGLNTQAALKTFQNNHGIIPATGTVGPKTRTALNAAFGCPATTSNNSQTYTNSQLGLSFQYPTSLDNGYMIIQSNLVSAFSDNTDIDSNGCYVPTIYTGSPSAYKPTQVTVNGISFCQSNDLNPAAGTVSGSYYYTTLHSGSHYTLVFPIFYTSCATLFGGPHYNTCQNLVSNFSNLVVQPLQQSAGTLIFNTTTTSTLKGDCNLDGQVTAADVALASQFAVGSATPTAQQLANCDVLGAGSVTSADVTAINRYLAGYPWPTTTITTSSQPTITSISPNFGAGGNKIVITGTNLNASGNTIQFYQNGQLVGSQYPAVLDTTAVDGTSLQFTLLSGVVPAVANYLPYQLRVSNSNGVSNFVGFTILPSQTGPLINSITPNQGGNGIYTIAGGNFTSTNNVTTVEFYQNGKAMAGIGSPSVSVAANGMSLQFTIGGAFVANVSPGQYQVLVRDSSGGSNLINFTLTSSTTPPTSNLEGDCNLDGAVTPADAALASQWAIGNGTPSAAQLANCAITNGKYVTSADVTAINRYLAGYPWPTTSVVPLTKSITITSPNGGSQWQVGNTYNITWTSTGFSSGATVAIGLLDVTDSWNEFFTNYAVPVSQGSYSWTIPAILGGQGGSTLMAGKQYEIEIAETTAGVPKGSLGEGYSGNFSITNSATTAPVSTLKGDCNGDGTVSAGDAALWSQINNGTAPTTAVATANCTGLTVSEILNYSAGIPWPTTTATSQPSITVTSPSGGEQWVEGSTHVITYTSNGLPTPDTMSITLLFPPSITNGSGSNNGTYANAVTATASNSGSFSWTIPSYINPGSGYVLDINDNLDRIDVKSNSFSIVAPTVAPTPTITVATPGTLTQGQQTTVTWTTTGTLPGSGNVNIVLMSSGGVGTVLASGVPSNVSSPTTTGIYSWTVPTSTPAGSYQIEVYNAYNATPTGYSGTFNIVAPSTTTSSQSTTASLMLGDPLKAGFISGSDITLCNVCMNTPSNTHCTPAAITACEVTCDSSISSADITAMQNAATNGTKFSSCSGSTGPLGANVNANSSALASISGALANIAAQLQAMLGR